MAITVMTKATFSTPLIFLKRRYAKSLYGVWYKYPPIGKHLYKVTIYNSIPRWVRLWCSWAYDTLTWVTLGSKQYPRGSKSPPKALSIFIPIGVHLPFLQYGQQILTAYFGQYLQHQVFNKAWLQAHYQQYHQILLDKELLPDWILPPAWWDRPEPYWDDFSQCSWMAIDEIVNRWSTHRHVIWFTTIWRYSQQRHSSPQEVLYSMNP
jgi:hypothetical protein